MFTNDHEERISKLEKAMDSLSIEIMKIQLMNQHILDKLNNVENNVKEVKSDISKVESNLRSDINELKSDFKGRKEVWVRLLLIILTSFSTYVLNTYFLKK